MRKIQRQSCLRGPDSIIFTTLSIQLGDYLNSFEVAQVRYRLSH